jgi:hypothetical protein
MDMALAAQHVHQASNSGTGLAVAIGVLVALVIIDKRAGKGGS